MTRRYATTRRLDLVARAMRIRAAIAGDPDRDGDRRAELAEIDRRILSIAWRPRRPGPMHPR